MSQFPSGPPTEAFLEAAKYAGELIASDRVGHSWQGPSVLDQMSVGEVAGHVFLVLRRVIQRAEEPIPPQHDRLPPPTAPTLAGWTWIRVDDPQDLDRPDHRRIRQDAAHVASWGWEAVRDAYTARIEKVTALLRQGSPPEVDISGQPISFAAYLATRNVELVVHADDLACSVGLGPTLPDDAVEICIRTLVDAARSVHGDLEVLRALTRRERAPANFSVF